MPQIKRTARGGNRIALLTLIRARPPQARSAAHLSLHSPRHGAKAARLSRSETERRLKASRDGTGEAIAMKHASSALVLDYWNDRRRNRPAPDRADIDPGEIRQALGDTFMLAADFVDELRFRLAGTRVCALFGREIKGESFATLFNAESRGQIDELIGVVTNEAVGAVAGLLGTAADGSETEVEMMLLPLAHSGLARIRALGVMAPLTPPYWLGEKPLVELSLRTLRHLGDDSGDAPRVVSGLGGRVRHGFVVYRGGRETSPSGERTG